MTYHYRQRMESFKRAFFAAQLSEGQSAQPSPDESFEGSDASAYDPQEQAHSVQIH
jgi:hypothetical protein